MPRRENPLDPASGPLAAFACELRALRERAGGPTYRALAEKTGISTSVLSQAAAGRRLPTWRVTDAYVQACGGDVATWLEQWTEVARAITPAKQSAPSRAAAKAGQTSSPEFDEPPSDSAGVVDRPPEADAPDENERRLDAAIDAYTQPAPHHEIVPARGTPPPPVSRDEFAEQLDALRIQAGLSIRELQAVCGRAGGRIGVSAVHSWFRGRIPQPSVEREFAMVLHACGIKDPVDIQAWLDAARRLRRRGSPIDGTEPFRGLRSYDVEDSAKFFGRRQLITATLAEIDTLHQVGGGVVTMSGVSGSGKSSVLKAGVIAALCADQLDGSAAWPVVYAQSGRDPLRSLAHAIADKVGVATDDLLKELDDTAGMRRALLRLCRHPAEATASVAVDGRPSDGDGARLVVIVDQFEQAILMAERHPDDPRFAKFLTLLQVMTTGPIRTAIILAVRIDFLTAAITHISSSAIPRRSPVIVMPMTDDELKEVILGPVHDLHVTIDPGFVELLLRDVSARNGKAGHQAGTLPLLSHALRVTWEQGDKRALTVENYRAAGGVDGALQASAETAYESLTPGQCEVTRRMFQRLVDVHPAGADTRRRMPIDELYDEVNSNDELDVVLDRFVAQRLLTIDEDTVEITHDALMDAWPALRNWLHTDRAGLLVAQQLNADAREWDHHGRRESDLYTGTKLHTATEWLAQRSDGAAELTQSFLAASVRRSKRTARRLTATIAALVVLLIVAVVSTVVAVWNADALKRSRDEAQSRVLASRVSELRGKDVTLARQFALAAYRMSPTVEARSALLDATAMRPAVRMLSGDSSGMMYAVGMHPSGTVAAAATETSVKFWDTTKSGHPKLLPSSTGQTCTKIYALAFSPNGNRLIAACADGTIRLWDTHNPMAPVELSPLTGLGGKVYSVVFSPDGSMMAAALAESAPGDTVRGVVRLWRMTGTEPVALGGPVRVDDNAAAKSVSFHPSNQYLAVGTNDGTVQVWDISTPEQPHNPVIAAGPTKSISQVAWSPDGNTLAAGGADFLVHLWSTTEPRNPSPVGPPINGAVTWINAIAFSPDGTALAIASSDATVGVRLVDLASRQVTATMPHPAPVTSVKFSADGTTVISGANDGTARLWPVTAPVLEGMDYLVSATRFSPDGTTLAVGSADLRLFDITNPQRPKQFGPALTNPDRFSGTLAFSPNNRLLAEGRGRSGTVQLWDPTDPAHPKQLGPPLQAHTQQVETVTFSADSSLLATGSRDGKVHIWNVQEPSNPVLLATPGTFRGYVNEVSFSPNGKLLAAGSIDKTVRIWDISDPRNPTALGSLAPANHYVYSTVFSPDGTMLAVSLADSTVRLYDITDPASPKQIGHPLIGPENYVQSLSFTTDGTTLAASGNDGTVWIWDVRNRESPAVLARLTPAANAMYPVQFQPNSHLLTAGSGGKHAWIWTTNVDAAAALVCDTSGDAVTAAEWARTIAGLPFQPPCQS